MAAVIKDRRTVDANYGFNHTRFNEDVSSSESAKRKLETVTSTTISQLPRVDPQQLINRIVSVAPFQTAPLSPRSGTLVFKRPTKTQIKKYAVPNEPRLEPLPILQTAQKKNNPEFMRNEAQEKLKADKLCQGPDMIRRRSSAVEPLEHISPDHLPQLPDALKQKQLSLVDTLVVHPPNESKNPVRGSFHTNGPILRPTFKKLDSNSFIGLQDMHQIIKAIRENPKIDFLYLTPAAKKSSVRYHYYNLKVSDYEHTDRSDHCTMSQRGVTRIRTGEESDFISLNRFEEEFIYFEKLVKIKVFKVFRKWKAFNDWRNNVRNKKFQNSKKNLNENLFVVNAALRPALLNVREMCYRISDMGLCKFEKNHMYDLLDFKEAQFAQLREVSVRLEEFRELVKEVVRSACRTALLEANFTPDDYFYDGIDGIEGGQGMASNYLQSNQYDIDIYGEAPDKMTYTEQACKRENCKRLTCFIRLVDYLIVNTMHLLAVNSISTILCHLSNHLQRTPSLDDIKSWTKIVDGAIALVPTLEAKDELKKHQVADDKTKKKKVPTATLR